MAQDFDSRCEGARRVLAYMRKHNAEFDAEFDRLKKEKKEELDRALSKFGEHSAARAAVIQMHEQSLAIHAEGVETQSSIVWEEGLRVIRDTFGPDVLQQVFRELWKETGVR